MESGLAILPEEVMLQASRMISPPQRKSLPVDMGSHGRSTPLNSCTHINRSTNGGALQRPSDTVRVMMMSPLRGTRSPSLKGSHGQLSGKCTLRLSPSLRQGITASSSSSSCPPSTSSSSSSLERCLEASSAGSSSASSSALIGDPDPKYRHGFKGSVLSVCTAGSAAADSSWWNGAVAYEGSPTRRAVTKAYPACQPIHYGHVEAVFSALESRMVDRAMLPLAESEDEMSSSSCGAPYHRIYDLILRHSGLHVVAAVHECHESAGADGNSSRRRFWVVSRDPWMPATSLEDPTYRTTVALVLSEGLGSLYKALAAFPFRGIHVTRVETRPWRQQPLLIKPRSLQCTTQSYPPPADPCTSTNATADKKHIQSHHYIQFQYVVLIDFQGSTADLSTQNVLAQLQQHCSFLRILGSYPTFDFHYR